MGKKSAADICINKLKQYISNYDKANINQYSDELFSKIESAIKNAKKSLADAKETNTPNPSTNIHELVAELQRVGALHDVTNKIMSDILSH